MKREKFIQLMGIGAGTLLLSTCIGGCAKNSATPTPVPVPVPVPDTTSKKTQDTTTMKTTDTTTTKTTDTTTTKTTDTTSNTNTNQNDTTIVSLDLTQAANASLKNNGGFLVTNGVIVAKTNLGTYIAVQKGCTHEVYTLTYQGDKNRFYCNNHGATFSEGGVVTNGPAKKNLVTYKTELKGDILRVYS